MRPTSTRWTATDAAQADALVDPFGLVFDSQTGLAVDGARVRLVDCEHRARRQRLRRRWCEPLSLRKWSTGQLVTDQGGTQYNLPAGVFRFPLVTPGNYRLEVFPPGNYSFPSQRTVADLQTLPAAPYRLQQGSFGNTFVVTSRRHVALDIPLDPAGETLAAAQERGPADREHRRLRPVHDHAGQHEPVGRVRERPSSSTVAGRRALPPGSLTLDGVRIADPVVAPDGWRLHLHARAHRCRPDDHAALRRRIHGRDARRERMPSTPRARSRRVTWHRTKPARSCA